MKKIWKLVLVCLLALPGLTRAQPENVRPDDPALFLKWMQTQLSNTNDPVAIALSTDLGNLWGVQIGPDLQIKVMDQIMAMNQKGYKAKPHFIKYFSALSHAINTESIDRQKLTDYLNMTGHVIKSYHPKHVTEYFTSMMQFFEHRAIYYGNVNKLYIENDSYSFDFVIPEPVVTEPQEPTVETQEVTDEVFDDWDTEPTEDDWGTDWGEDTSWGDEVVEETQDEVQQEDNSDDLTHLIQEVQQPEIRGPVVQFSKVDLTFNTPYDSSTLEKTKGTWMIKDGLFVGEEGTFNWSAVGLSSDSVFVEFTKYNLAVHNPGIFAEKTIMTYQGRLAEPVEGVFEHNGKVPNNNRYPRFISYQNNIKVDGLGKDNLVYKGGFALHGDRIQSSSIFGGLAQIEIHGDQGMKFKARSRLFRFNEDSTITANRASVVIYHNYDSIYHPTVRVNYNTGSERLILQKDQGGFKRTPYESSFFNVDFVADILYWDLNADSLNISILSARNEIPALFTSNEFFDPKQVTGVIGLWDFNPLQMVVGYANETMNPFFLENLVKKVGKNRNSIRSAMMYLMWAGYIDFNVKSGLVTVREKAFNTIKSKWNRKDFDNLQLFSLVGNQPNATFYFGKDEMKVRGVDRFFISEILDVYIIPDNSEITLLENRGFQFDGRVFAGNFEYIGKDFTFDYDNFSVKLDQIDKIQFYVLEEDSRGSRRRKVDNALSGNNQPDSTATDSTAVNRTSGTLFINRPDNKSGRKIYPSYPKFDGEGAGSMVFFNTPEYLNGVYDRSIYFQLPPFKIDSLSDSDPASIGFSGTFGSSGMLPDFKETMTIQPDYSLGFEHMMPPDGYQLFRGPGVAKGTIYMDKAGLRSNGSINYLSTELSSDRFVFYIDSIKARGTVADIKEETINGITFPQMHVEDFSMRWLAKKDSMFISNNADPIELYQRSATLDGTAIVSQDGVRGSGSLLTRGSEVNSPQYRFDHDRFSARFADFLVNSSIEDKPALTANNSKLNFNLADNTAEIQPEIAGEAVLEFPFAQFKTSIPSAIWELDSQKVKMTKPDAYDIRDSYFYTTREDLDSLAFNATDAVYDIKTLELKVSGIPYITVADARITPEGGEVLILENSKIGTLYNTTIVMDTLNQYHRLYDGTITIISRNEFEGEATYEFVNAVQDTFAIKLTDFRLENVLSTEDKGGFSLGKKKVEQELHTVADGNIAASDGVIVSPGMFYKGDVKLFANRPFLELDGFVKLDLKKIANYDTWIKYQHDGKQGEVVFNFDESLTEGGQKLTAGLHFDLDDFSLYSTFITNKRSPQDEDFFVPSGFLRYSADSSEFVIIDKNKEENNTLAGKVFAFKENTGDIRLEGPISFIQNNKSRSITSSGMGYGNIETNEFSFNTLMAFDYDIPGTAYEIIAADLLRAIKEYGAPEAITDQTSLLYKLAEIIGNKAASAYETRAAQEYVPLVSTSPNMVRPLVFSEIQLQWSDLNKAFFSTDMLGMSNVLRNDINAAIEGFLEITKNIDGEKIDLFFKASADSWFYFGYENNKLITFSSNQEYNNLIKDKTNSGKAKIGEFVFVPGDMPETLDFINRFRKDYLNITEPYVLDAPVDSGTAVKKKDKDVADDDEGF